VDKAGDAASAGDTVNAGDAASAGDTVNAGDTASAGDTVDASDTAESTANLRIDLELLRQMTFYCTTSDCLRAFILRYFGESYSPYCGNCGSCQTSFEEADITIEAQKIVSCVIRVVRALENTTLPGMGQTTVCDILRGKDSEKLRRWRLDQLPTFSIMADVPVKRLRQIIDFLVYQGYLSLSLGKYPALLPGPRAAEIVRERRQLTIKLPRDADKQPKRKGRHEDVDAYSADGAGGADADAAARAGAGLDAYSADGAGAGATTAAGADSPQRRTPSTSTSAQAAAARHREAGPDLLSPADAQLFEQLRALRASLAADAQMPAYIVFSDASLRAICLRRPTTPDEFLEVNGVGAVKAERYGEAFLRAVREFESQE
jgi:ATP-dependent DNA helicase RecQ